MADEKPEERKKAAGKKASKKKSAKKPVKKAASEARDTKAAARRFVGKKTAARKPVPIKKARVGKRAVLPRLPPPPTVPLKSTRSPARRASRVKALLRNKGAVKASPAVCEVAACTEAALREKLRLAAPYVEVWLARRDSETLDAAEAAFVRIWQWLTLEAMLDDRRIVTLDLLDALFAEEVGRGG
ncbi:MAG TPA: hypothetical protein VKA03_10125 [Methylovirgula sp.]|nr:hypothetical protein [Methylovirgula sp.]